MKIIRRLAAIAVASMVLAGGVSAVAHSTEGPTNVVFWQMNGEWDEEPTSGNAFPEPQDFHSYGVGSDLNTEPRVALECDTWYQVDAYVATHQFKAGDKLTGPPMDAPYHQDPAQWRFVYGGDCEPDHVTKYTPTFTVTCDAATYSHPLFKGGFGFADTLLLYVGETEAEAQASEPHVMQPGEVFTHEFADRYAASQVYFETKVMYDGQTFEQKLGHRLVKSEACKPPAPEPESDVDVVVDAYCTDPADGTLTTTTTTTSWTQERYWSQNAGKWLKSAKVYGEPETTTEVTQDESCIPVKPEPKSGTESGAYDYCTEPADGTRTHVMTETAWVQDWAWSQEAGEWVLGDKVFGEPKESGLLTQDVECAAPEVPVTPEEPKAPSFTPVKSTPVPPAKVDTDVPVLARTGAESTIPLALGALALVGAGALAIRRARA